MQIQNPKSKFEIQDPKFAQKRIATESSKIQNPNSEVQNPKSKIQNPKSKIQTPKSKIQDPRPKIQNPRSKIQNPKSKIGPPGGSHKELLHNGQKSKIQIPKSQKPGQKSLDFGWNFGFGILDFQGSRERTSRQFGHGALRSEARTPPGPGPL